MSHNSLRSVVAKAVTHWAEGRRFDPSAVIPFESLLSLSFATVVGSMREFKRGFSALNYFGGQVPIPLKVATALTSFVAPATKDLGGP